MTAVSDILKASRSQLYARMKTPPTKKRGRPPLPDGDLVERIKAIIGDAPTYGYRRVHAILRREDQAEGRSWPNQKRVYRVMKAHGMLLNGSSEKTTERRHDGRVAVDQSNLRWCSDGFEISSDNREKSEWPSFWIAATGKRFPGRPRPRALKARMCRTWRCLPWKAALALLERRKKPSNG